MNQPGLGEGVQGELLFAVSPSGRLRVAVDGVLPTVAAGDTVICLAPPVSEPDSGPG